MTRLLERRINKEEARVLKRFEENHDYIATNIEELKKEYLNQYVAVYDGRVVDHGTDFQGLVDRLWKKYPQEDYFSIGIEPILEKGEKHAFGSDNCATLYAQSVVPAV